MLNFIIVVAGAVHVAGCIGMAADIIHSGLDYTPLGLAMWCQIWPLYLGEKLWLWAEGKAKRRDER